MASKWKGIETYGRKHGNGFKLKIDYDFTDLQTLHKNINKLNNRHIKVGWLKAKKHKGSKLYLAQLAHIQEYGVKHSDKEDSKSYKKRQAQKADNMWKIPPRPYVRQTMKDWGNILRSDAGNVFEKLIKNQDFESEVSKIGYKSKIAFHNNVMKQNMRKLAAWTINKKGHAFQWDDTGQLLHNFDYQVYESSIEKAERQAAKIAANKAAKAK